MQIVPKQQGQNTFKNQTPPFLVMNDRTKNKGYKRQEINKQVHKSFNNLRDIN
jgi:hypothetical protein